MLSFSFIELWSPFLVGYIPTYHTKLQSNLPSCYVKELRCFEMIFSLYILSGVLSEGVTPGSIPNPAVKTLNGDGTSLATGWESSKTPVFYFYTPPHTFKKHSKFNVQDSKFKDLIPLFIKFTCFSISMVGM